MREPAYRAHAGEYDHRATVWKNVVARTANADGQLPENKAMHCQRWVSVIPARATERLISQQIKADITHVVRMRRDSITKSITSAMWLILTDGTRLDIRGVFDVDERKVELLLECNERTA